MDSQLFALLRQFYALSPTNIIQYPADCSPKAVNSFLVNDILCSEHFQKYPPSNQYQKRFWKWLIQNLEEFARRASHEMHDDDFEIDSRIYDHYLALDSTSERAAKFGQLNSGLNWEGPPLQSYITHFWSTTRPFFDSVSPVRSTTYQTATLLESRTTIESGTTGLRTWLASFVLSQYLIIHPELILSKHILELGSGTGFLGIIIASLQRLHETRQGSPSGGSLWLTDVNDEVLTRCRNNVQLPCNLSSFHRDVNYLKLDWSDSIEKEQSSALAILIQEKIDPEVVLGADVVFDPSLIPPLVGTLEIALRPAYPMIKRKYALIALTVRNEATMNEFLSQVQNSSLYIEDLEIDFQRTSFSEMVDTRSYTENVRLFRITTTT